MKKINTYPDWVEKYRGKGKTIRKVRNGYGLYECTTVYVKGAKYPKSIQKYLGMITEKDGFIPKKDINKYNNYSIEYGLSHFILINFKRSLIRSTYTGDINIVYLGIIFYIFGSIDKTFILSTYLSNDCKDKLLKQASIVSINRVKGVSNKIESILNEKISDKKDKLLITKLLMFVTIPYGSDDSDVVYPDIIKTTIEKYGLKL